jgi:hypothetical protein
MKTILVAGLVAMSVSMTFAQGTVVFANTPTTLVSSGPMGQEAPITGSPGSFFFGLLIAPPGTVAPSQFTFTGVYATNAAIAGRILPASYVPVVPGWPIVATISFLVAGWSASLGHDWNQQWMSGSFGEAGYFGLSTIGTGMSGSPFGQAVPPLPLFGPANTTVINTGWNLNPVPEPSTVALLALGTMTLMLRPRSAARRPWITSK